VLETSRNQTKILEYLFATCTIDAHGLKIQWRGYLMFFAKIPRGGQGFQEKLPGGSPYFGFIAFLLTSVLKFA
jgi:hypothetical protein